MSIPERPRLRRELTWKRFVVEGHDSYIFKNEITQEYLKLDPISGMLAEQMDGHRTRRDLLAYAWETWPGINFDEDYIADLLADFKRMKFLDDPFETNAMVTARAAQQRGKINAAMFRNLLQIQMGAINPDRFLTRTYPRVRWFFTPAAVALGVALFIASIYWIYLNRDNVAGANYIALAAGRGFTGFACVWLSTILVMFVHEFGHAYAVKHHGGKVDTIGFMLMFGLVAMYCDTSDAHLFSNRVHRMQVALAGTYTGFYLMPLSVGLWWITPPDQVLNYFAYCMIVFLGVTTVVFNYNPLIKLDGYFVLADMLDMPGLQEDAWAYLGYLVRRYVLRVQVECPVVGRRRKQILVLYGVLSLAYTIFFTVLMFLFFRSMLIKSFAFLGALASLALLYAVAKKPVGPLVRSARLWALDHRGMIRRRMAPIIAGAVALVALIFVVPVPGTRTLVVSLQPAREAALTAPEDMRIGELRFAAGRPVLAGDVLAVLDADSIAVDLGASRGRVRSLAIASRAARLAGDPVDAVLARERGRTEASHARLLSREMERALLRAPFDGTVLSLSAPWRVGEPLVAGDTVCVIGDFSAARAVATVDEFDLDELRSGARVRVRLQSAPAQALPGRVGAIEPAPAVTSHGAVHKQYRVWMALDGTPASPRAGLTGLARVTLPARTPASRFYRWAVRFVRLDLWV
jgi:putative peptide zinc metalloprotease protein